jgi:anti-sigma regulatory factor (Ser/Thr protein kinase)
MNKTIRIEFTSSDRGEWIRLIHDYTINITAAESKDIVDLVFNRIEICDIEPVHLVTLACMIELFVKNGYSVVVSNADSPIGMYLFDTLQFSKYWMENKNYVPVSGVDSILNLWRLVDGEKENYSQMVHDYLQGRFFKNKDLSAVKNSLLEAYYNISDHAEADGNAFSFIKFDETTRKLHVAICDFGKGIASTVRAKLPEIGNDAMALEKAMEDLFTVGSQGHNMGWGLGNIRRTCMDKDVLRIVSNRGFLYSNSDFIHVRENNNIINGTLIYYELSLDHFDDLEIIPNFEL